MEEDRRVETALASSGTAKSTRYRLYRSGPVSRAWGNKVLKGVLISCHILNADLEERIAEEEPTTTQILKWFSGVVSVLGFFIKLKFEINVSIYVDPTHRLHLSLNPLPTNLPTSVLVCFAIIIAPAHHAHAHGPSGMPHDFEM